MEIIPGVLDAQAERAADPAGPAGPPAGDATFQRMLEEASPQPATPESPPVPASIERFNSMNLLNGQFPPPDSGAGYLFISVALKNEFDA